MRAKPGARQPQRRKGLHIEAWGLVREFLTSRGNQTWAGMGGIDVRVKVKVRVGDEVLSGIIKQREIERLSRARDSWRR